jgi:SAM-dependent methyltransferase
MISQMLIRVLKQILPSPVAEWLRSFRLKEFQRRSQSMSTETVFTRIYEEGIWGTSRDSSTPFYSGSGSHDAKLTDAYVDAVAAFLQSLPAPPDVVDLGCGDFGVGSRIRPFCGRYVACDIVKSLIEFNARRFADLNVEFRAVNLVQDPLPEGYVVFIRQVLQHLSNAEIANAIPQIVERYRYLILTEHLPATADFVPNIDKRAGADIRLERGSGLVLTEPPFSLKPKETMVLCDVPEFNGRVQTILYRLR